MIQHRFQLTDDCTVLTVYITKCHILYPYQYPPRFQARPHPSCRRDPQGAGNQRIRCDLTHRLCHCLKIYTTNLINIRKGL